MKTDSAPAVPLTREDNVYCMGHMRNPCSYERHPTNPIFVCCLYPDITQKLITDPNSILRTPKIENFTKELLYFIQNKKPKDSFFWLRTLVEGIRTGGQFVFETFPPQGTNNQQNKLAVRTLFQLDGDMLVKIDEHILARTDGIGIIKAHLSWTNWCFEQLKGALSFTRILRCVQCLLYIIAVFLSGFGVQGVCTKSNWWLLVILLGISFGLMARKLISFCLKQKIKQFL
ncbi:MAG: hypothetical protein KAV25_09280 [Methanophagales archaeon]|nr:hypothetical protein [Methanophagales archaeon]